MKHLEKLFDLSADILCVAGSDGYFRLVSPSARRVLGYTDQEMRSVPFLDLVHPEDRNATVAEMQKLGSGVTTLRFENRYRCKDGTFKWLAWTSVPNLEDDLVYAVARDVTEARDSLDHLMNDLPGTVYRCRNDRDRSMEFVSKGCASLTGYEPDAIIHNRVVSYASLIHPEDRDRVCSDIEIATARGREFQLEYRINTADRVEKHVWERGRAITDRGVTAVQGYIVDITERRALRDELNQLQRMESLGQLTGGVAHDFNNLLTVVLGNLQLLAEQNLEEPIGELVKDAMDAAWRGAELSQRLLAFSRRQMLSPEVIDVNSLVRGMDSILCRTLAGPFDLTARLEANLPPVLMDPGQLENAILNLVINARDAMSGAGKLLVQTGTFNADADYAAAHPDVQPGEYVVVEVSDTGSGMTPEVLDRAFEPFYTTKGPGKGTGLGLSMVYGLLKQSGGHIRIYSEVGHGTTVRLFIPKAPAGERSREDAERAADIALGSERILVVEDDLAVRKSVIGMVSKLGYQTLQASSVSEAIEVLRRERPDLLFTDMVMGDGGNGIDLVHRAREIHPDLKVLLTSGFSEQHVRALPEFPLLRKPYPLEQLAKSLRSALDST